MKVKKKKHSKNIRKSLSLINKIQKIRSKNNKNWMDLVKLSLKLDTRDHIFKINGNLKVFF